MNEYLMSCSESAIVRRAQLLREIRGFFDGHDFVEVETPVLSRDTVVDRHLDPVSVSLSESAEQLAEPQEYFLQTSPEFGMKRLLASGLKSIYQITRAFRLGELGPQHNFEFSMLEWYRVGDDYQAGIDWLGKLAGVIFGASSWEQATYREIFQEQLGVDPFSISVDRLREFCPELSIPEMGQEDQRELLLDAIFTEHVQPRLGQTQPLVVCDYPASQSALAKVRSTAAGEAVAERFELFVRGVELANGYHELTDPDELKRRNQVVNQQRAIDGKRQLPEDSAMLRAMQYGLPDCAGVAMGLDRVLMLLLETDQIGDVLSFPFGRA